MNSDGASRLTTVKSSLALLRQNLSILLSNLVDALKHFQSIDNVRPDSSFHIFARILLHLKTLISSELGSKNNYKLKKLAWWNSIILFPIIMDPWYSPLLNKFKFEIIRITWSHTSKYLLFSKWFFAYEAPMILYVTVKIRKRTNCMQE